MGTQISKDVHGPLTVNPDNGPGVVIRFPDGNTAQLGLADLPKDIVTRLAVHGLSQKLGDGYAGAGSKENPLGFAKTRVQEIIEQLKSGDWRVTAEAGPRVTLLARALARATGNSIEDAMAVIADRQDSLSEDDYKAWTKQVNAQPGIKKAKAEIKLEDAQKAAQAAPSAGDADELASLIS